MPPAAKSPTSPGDTSTNSSPARPGTAAAATAAADRAFSTPQPLGLDAAPETQAGEVVGRERLKGAYLIDIARIEADPNQPRKKIDPDYLRELTQSVRELGVLQPITVRYVAEIDRYRIIAGECRFTAARSAGLPKIPCWVKSPSAEHILLEQIVENWQRSDLNPFDIADSLAVLRDGSGFTQQQLAQRTGKSAGEISKLLSLLDLDLAVQKVARDDTSGTFTKRHLYSLSRLPSVQQPVVLERVRRDSLSALDTEKLIGRMVEKRDKPNKGGAPVTRRAFSTRYASVVFTYRKKDVTGTDLLMTLREVKQQIIEQGGDPADFA